MKSVKWSLLILALSFLFLKTTAQDKRVMSDSLKHFVIKFEPFSIVNNHMVLGAEIPLSNFFLDVNLGWSQLLNTENSMDRSGGVLTKVGVKVPISSNTPSSILYLMPEVAFTNYKATDYSIIGLGKKNVNATALLLCLGYRHLRSDSKLYYDLGGDLGFGWSNYYDSYNNYNFIILSNGTNQQKFGLAISCHISIGIAL